MPPGLTGGGVRGNGKREEGRKSGSVPSSSGQKRSRRTTKGPDRGTENRYKRQGESWGVRPTGSLGRGVGKSHLRVKV